MLTGINSNPRQGFDVSDLGIKIVRFPLWWKPFESAQFDYEGYAQQLIAGGMIPLAVLDRPAFAYRQGQTYEAFISKLVALFPSIQYWQVGNEPDGTAGSMSSNMTPWTFERILNAGRIALAGKYMIAGAFARGTYNYVTRPGLVEALGACEGIAANLYGLRPEGFAAPGWGVGDLSSAYELLAGQRWAGNKDLWITELGGEDSYFNSGNEKAAHHVASLDTLAKLGARAALIFCYSDLQVDQFGVVAGDGTQKPVYSAVKQYAAANPSV